MQNEDAISSIDQLETFIEFYKQGVERLREKDSELTQRYKANMSLFADVMPHVYESFKDYRPSNGYIYMEVNEELNLYREDVSAPFFSNTPKAQSKEKVLASLASPNKTFLNLDKADNHPSRHVFYSNKMLDEMHKQSQGLMPQSTLPSFAGAAVFFGLELGYQLEAFIALQEVKHLYIYERNLDCFYYSLFAIDWQPILENFNRDGRTIHFFLGVEPEEFTDKYVQQLTENGYFMAPETLLHVAYSSPENDQAMAYFQKHYVRQVIGWGFFDDALIGIAQGLRALPNTKLAEFKGRDALPKWVSNIPVFILGNGPSLDEGIDLVKQVRDQVLVISCGSTINTLKKLGITPDIHVDIERMKQTVDKFLFLDQDYLDQIWGLSVDVMHPEYFQYFKRSGMGLKPGEAITSLILSQLRGMGDTKDYVQLNFCNPVVANLALSYVHLFGFNTVYYLGVDTGFKNKDSHHSVHSGYYKDGKETGFQTFQDAKLIELEGNFGGVTYATNIMNSSRVQLESLTRILNKRRGFNSYNLSDGAKIEGVEPLKIDDVMIFDPAIDHKEAINQLESAFFTSPPDAFLDPSPQALISIDDFNQVVKTLSTGWDDTITTREDVCNLLWSHHRAIQSLKATNQRHLHDLLIGSFTYSSFLIVKFIFAYHDEQDVVRRARHLFRIWSEFLEEMPSLVQQASDFVDQGNDHLITFYNG